MDLSLATHKVGLSLRPAHYPYLEDKPVTEVAWFEAISENHMQAKGYSLEILKLVRQSYPVALQGFSMNIGSSDGVCLDYLQHLRDLTEQIDPFLVVDHFCWTGISDSKWHGIFPLPFTKESVKTLVKNIDFAQNFLRRPIALKNISTYITFHHNEMTEWDFISEVIQKSGCKLVLDLNSLFINSKNHNYDLHKFIANIPFDQIAQIQLAGPIDFGDFLFDSRSQEVPEYLWDLFQSLAPRIRHLPILISRNDDIPNFIEMESEVMKAVFILENSHETERITEAI